MRATPETWRGAARLGALLAFVCVCMCADVGAEPEADERPCVIVAVGAPGTEEYGAEFRAWAGEWAGAARAGGATVVRVGWCEDAAAPAGKDDRSLLREALEREAARSTAPLWLVLIGHGTFDGAAAKFNLRGPDVEAAELARWLASCARPLAVINCASASGPFINRLSGPERVVITATRSGYEHNLTRFGRHMAAAIAGEGKDLDRDGQVSLLEAFLAASAATAEFYKQEARLATEHALIDDNGDGLGTPAEWFRGIRAVRRAADGAALDGARANRFALVPGPGEREMPPEVRRRRDELEAAIEALRAEKARLDPDEYFARLEEVLVELARLYEALGAQGRAAAR